MEHDDLRTGILSRTGNELWGCTDVGTRTIAAIHLEHVHVNGSEGPQILSRQEAEKQALFEGPPYVVGESIFDEYDFEGCEPDVRNNFPGYAERPLKHNWSQAVRGPWPEALATLRERRARLLDPTQESGDGNL